MTGSVISMLTDGIIIVLLIGTIFYAARLSHYLKTFRNSRKEIEGLISDLSVNIEKAEMALESVKKNARDAGRDLQDAIDDAAAMSNELELITQAGDRLATRLDLVMDKGRAYNDGKPLQQTKTTKKDATEEGPFDGFVIRDPEFQSDYEDDFEEDMVADAYDDEDESMFQSQAEKDLYQALKRNKSDAGGMR